MNTQQQNTADDTYMCKMHRSTGLLYTHMHARTYARAHTHTDTHTYTHTDTNTHTHTDTNTHTVTYS